jgi:DNA-binding NarL/FixJ family response regulator
VRCFSRPRRSVRVLLVEDNDVYARTLELLFDGHETVNVVGRARDGEEGVRLALALRPERVLMDLSMPVMDGLEATRRLRDELPSAGVVMLTSSDDPADRAGALAAGALEYLTKDARPEEIEAALIDAAPAQIAQSAPGSLMIVLPT